MAISPAKIAETHSTLKRAARQYDASYLACVLRFLKLYRVEHFRHHDIFRLGLADPATPPEVMAEVISQRRATYWQQAINPRGYISVMEDKGVFYNYCVGAKIRVPRLYAIYDTGIGRAPGGRWLDSSQTWTRFIQDDLPQTFVIKPNRGLHGRGVQLVARDGTSFIDQDGKRISATDLVQRLATNQDFDRFIIQERLESHPDLVALTGSGALHTMRIVTRITKSGDVLTLFAAQKLALGSNPFDNFFAGASGNLIAEVDLESGRVTKAVTTSEEGLGLVALDTHPTSGLPLEGFQVPFWPEARALTVEAARKFVPVRCVGWDIAITADGPVIVEGNYPWGVALHNALRNISPFKNYAKDMLGTDKMRPPLGKASRKLR